jgi:hypothetical protein
MELHRPKPLGGWRGVAGGIGVIVVGVAIALGGEHAVEALLWRRQVAEARASLDRQAAEQLFLASESVALEGCEMRQLDRLAEIVDRPGPTPQLRRGVTLRVHAWNTSPWQAATASGVLAHMPRAVRQDYAEHFGMTETLGALNRQEFTLVSDLGTLGAPEVLSDTARDRLASDIARLRGLDRLMATASRQMVGHLQAMGIRMAAQDSATLKREQAAPCLMPDA